MARILIVDDEPDVVRLIFRTLAPRGHNVHVSRDGISALARARREMFDLIVVDRELPRLDGTELCRRLKSDPSTRPIPIVLMTDFYIDLDDVGVSNGPDAFVVRPFVREVLANVVERALHRG